MDGRKQNYTGFLMFGVILCFLGLGFILDNLGVVNFGHFIGQWWPSLIIGSTLINFLFRSTTFGNVVVSLLIFLPIQLAIVDRLPYKFWSYFWPTVLMIGGISVIYSNFTKSTSDNSEDSVHNVVLFSGNDIHNNSQHFKGGELTAFAGGIKLDLRDADVESGAHLKTTAFMGGIELLVPRTWKVVVKGLPLMGGFSNKVPSEASPNKILNVDATAVMGGVEVKYL